MRVKDEQGNIIPGLYRTSNGSIIVDDKEGYDKYIKQRNTILNQKSSIDKLQDEVSNLKEMIATLIKKIG